jgi:ubiquinone/menaquinone biosynthesis C-methylase UbiE
MEQSEWDRLFDELYLRTYAPLQDEATAAPMARDSVALAGVDTGADVLDAACGFGRHSLVLAGDGYRVTGIDRSEVLLEEARRRSQGAEWPRWVRGDVRELPFPAGSFDLVLNLFSSVLGYYGEGDDVHYLSECRRVLRPGGKLVLDTMHRDRLMSVFAPRSWERLPDGILVEERSFDLVTGVITVLHELRPDKGEPQSITYPLRVYTAGEVAGLLRSAGFTSVELFGGLDGVPLTRETRLVALAVP